MFRLGHRVLLLDLAVLLKGSLVHELQFVRLQKACSKSLDTFHIESRQTLNLLASVNHFPESVENKTALQFQRNREKRAQTDYRRRRRELFRLVPAEQECL